MISQEKVQSILEYSPNSGEFTYRVSRGPIKKGRKAGTVSPQGYVYIMVEGKRYCAHRLAWLHTYGFLPNAQIDHIDTNKSNNSIRNLREATAVTNGYNRGLQRNNTSGHKGVFFDSRSHKWVVRVGKKGEKITLGSFSNKEEAITIRERYEIATHAEFRYRK